MGLYSLVAWPPEPLARWVTDVQNRLSFGSFGAPHLNVRTPFEYAGDEGTLIDGCVRALRGVEPFDVRFRAWRRFPHTIFLELERSAPLMDVHSRVLENLPVPPSTRDAEGYIPHLTLALGLCTWAEDDAWASVVPLVPPMLSWPVRSFALTLENKGEIIELARFPLTSPPEAEAPSG